MARSRKECEYCTDSDSIISENWQYTNRNGFRLWVDFQTEDRTICVNGQANDEDGYMLEDFIEIPLNYCPVCGRKINV